jgi:hypothetical protein
MAKGKGGNVGCLGLFIVMLPFWWAYDKCTGGDERRAQEKIVAETQEVARQAAAAAQVRRVAQARAEQEAALAAAKVEVRRGQLAQLAAWKPYQRSQALAQCFKSECPDGVPDEAALLESAKSDAERKQLSAMKGQLEKAQERAEKAASRSSAALRCCDGSLSPKCTCGGGRRGCCSRHGGVCGCSADD